MDGSTRKRLNLTPKFKPTVCRLFVKICYNKIMADNKQKLIKKLLGLDDDTQLNFSFAPNKDFVIYDQYTTFEGKPFRIKVDVKPHLPSEPAIALYERF